MKEEIMKKLSLMLILVLLLGFSFYGCGEYEGGELPPADQPEVIE